MTQPQLEQTSTDSERGVVQAPDLIRVTIVAKYTQVDIAIPSDIPVGLVLPSVVDMIAEHSKANTFDNDGERFEPADWVLARMGEPPFSNSLGLGVQGVHDGELLMLESAAHTAVAPLFDDIMYHVANAAADQFITWTPRSARRLSSALAVVTMLVGCLGLLAAPQVLSGVLTGSIALGVAIALVVAATVLNMLYDDPRTALLLGGCALPPAFTAGALFVPDPYGWAQLLLGCTLLWGTAVMAWRVTGVGLGLFVGVSIAAIYAISAALVGLLTDQPVRAIGAFAAALGLGGLSLAPRLSMLLAKLPLPPVPAPGTPIDPTEEHPDDQRALPDIDTLRESTERARAYLNGLVAATMSVTVVGALAATDPLTNRGDYWPGIALALVCAVVLLFRSRTYASAAQAAMLLSGGAMIVLAMLIGASFLLEQPLMVFSAAMLTLIAILLLGLIVPNQSATPPMRRAAELIEYGFVAAVLPLVFWVSALYSVVRGL